MLEPKDLTIDNVRFNLTPLRGLKVLRLDKKVISLLLPVFKGLDISNMNDEIDLGRVMEGLTSSLDSLDDVSYEKFIIDLFSSTTIVEEGKAPYNLDSQTLDTMGIQPTTLYKAMFEVMKYNKFTPFALGLGGSGIAKMFGSAVQTEKTSN